MEIFVVELLRLKNSSVHNGKFRVLDCPDPEEDP
jgi:hypothetical protein